MHGYVQLSLACTCMHIVIVGTEAAPKSPFSLSLSPSHHIYIYIFLCLLMLAVKYMYSMHAYLLMDFKGPILLDGRVTEVHHLLQHGAHECGPQFSRVGGHPLPCHWIIEVLTIPSVVVEGWELVQERTATLHVPI